MNKVRAKCELINWSIKHTKCFAIIELKYLQRAIFNGVKPVRTHHILAPFPSIRRVIVSGVTVIRRTSSSSVVVALKLWRHLGGRWSNLLRALPHIRRTRVRFWLPVAHFLTGCVVALELWRHLWRKLVSLCHAFALDNHVECVATFDVINSFLVRNDRHVMPVHLQAEFHKTNT